MNEAHEFCGSDEWRQMIREVILPWALGETDLGDDVLEVGPGYGATTDVLGTVTTRLRSVEIDDDLAASLRERFADSPTVEINAGFGSGFLILTITDRGKGFDAASVESGLGLASLRSRAEKAGGDTTLHSRLGRGTTVRVLLPI